MRRTTYWTGILLVASALTLATATVARSDSAGLDRPAEATAADLATIGFDPLKTWERFDFFAHRALRKAGTTAAQRQQVNRMIELRLVAMTPDIQRHVAMQAEMRRLLAAESIDRAAIEELRQRQLALADRTSRRLVDAAVEIAEQLTPEQRSTALEYLAKSQWKLLQ